jgi:hypothetical protein
MAGSLEGFLITTHLQDYPWECDIGITICYGYLSSSLCYCSFFLLFFFLFTTAFNTHTKLFLQTYMNYLPHRAPVIRSYRRQRVHVSFAIYNPKSLHKNRSTHSNSASAPLPLSTTSNEPLTFRVKQSATNANILRSYKYPRFSPFACSPTSPRPTKSNRESKSAF